MLWLRAYAHTKDRVSARGAGRCPGVRRRAPTACWILAGALAHRRLAVGTRLAAPRAPRERCVGAAPVSAELQRRGGSPAADDPTGSSFRARRALDENARLKVVRKMYSMRFGEDAPERRSAEQLRGMEGRAGQAAQ